LSFSDDQGIELSFSNEMIHIDDYFDNSNNVVLDYTLYLDHNVPFIKVDDEKWLCLFSKQILIIWKSDSNCFFYGFYDSPKLIDMFISNGRITASSYLVEGNRMYFPEDIGKILLGTPWVEGVEGNGIGESITIDWSKEWLSERSVQTLIIFNGYISYSKPYLYTKNSRVKTVKISNMENEFEAFAMIEDTPNPQAIRLPLPTKNVVIEIVSVYPGTEWEDTCINTVWAILDGQSYLFPADDCIIAREDLGRHKLN